mgnify:CR=1 FL=1
MYFYTKNGFEKNIFYENIFLIRKRIFERHKKYILCKINTYKLFVKTIFSYNTTKIHFVLFKKNM